MATISTERARLSDAAEMAPRMRTADAREVRASGGYTPQGALERSIRLSGEFAWTTRYDGEIMGIWGVAVCNILSWEGIPWLLTSDLVDRHPKEFYKICKKVVPILRSRFVLLSNRIDARHDQAIRWARRLGFEVASEAEDFGVEGRPFFRIDLRGSDHV